MLGPVVSPRHGTTPDARAGPSPAQNALASGRCACSTMDSGVARSRPPFASPPPPPPSPPRTTRAHPRRRARPSRRPTLRPTSSRARQTSPPSPPTRSRSTPIPPRAARALEPTRWSPRSGVTPSPPPSTSRPTAARRPSTREARRFPWTSGPFVRRRRGTGTWRWAPRRHPASSSPRARSPRAS